MINRPFVPVKPTIVSTLVTALLASAAPAAFADDHDDLINIGETVALVPEASTPG